MSTPQNSSRNNSVIKSLISFTYPELYTGKEWYVGFYAYDPVRGQMRRKKIKINFVKGVTNRRKFGEALKRRVALQLESGWNPWIEAGSGREYATFIDVVNQYKRHMDKMFHDDLYREDTYVSYLSYVKILQEYNSERKIPATYIYQLDETYCSDFLEYAYIDRNNCARTRDNYLGWLKGFCGYLIQHRYIKTNPTEGIKTLSGNLKKKQRILIAPEDVVRLHEYLEKKNKHYLLACYLLYYCFIRPKELSLIRISNFSLSRQTIFIPDTTSKNKKSGTITLPAKVVHLMIDLDIFKYPGTFYLFSDSFRPGSEHHDNKHFRDYWSTHIRRDLRFSKNVKFYSLKDTGITNMLRTVASLSVRDQARHSSLLMTDIYTPHDLQQADELIKNHDGSF